MKVTTVLAAAAALLAVAGPATAQAERYELGVRLKRFEEAWERHTDTAARKPALATLPPLTRQFFSFQFGEAAHTLDTARHLLAGRDATPAERWFDAVAIAPERRLLDGGTKELRVEVRTFYRVPGATPDGVTATLRLGDGPVVAVPIGKLPTTVAVPVPSFDANAVGWDFLLTFEAAADGKAVAKRTTTVSVFRDLVPLLAILRREADAEEKRGGPTIETATLRARAAFLESLRGGLIPEHDYPAGDQFYEADHSLRELREPKGYFNATRPGQFWLTVPTGKGVTTAVRVFVPKGLDAAKPVPVVVALHGAGGSENLFFEGYGNGQIVRECEKRGWLLVAPRSPLDIFGGPPPAAAVVEKLAGRYPIDPSKVFLVGHSMGAAQAIELTQQHAGRFAAVAALGGSGRVRTPQPFVKVPAFVGVGTEDFALTGSRKLRDALTQAGAAVTHTEYAGVEHLVVVREALPDVFALFDRVAK